MNGQALPRNVKVIAACNPYRLRRAGQLLRNTYKKAAGSLLTAGDREEFPSPRFNRAESSVFSATVTALTATAAAQAAALAGGGLTPAAATAAIGSRLATPHLAPTPRLAPGMLDAATSPMRGPPEPPEEEACLRGRRRGEGSAPAHTNH